MVNVAVSSLGCTSIHFKPWVKINGNWNTVLHQILLPDIRYISGDTFVFQQDSTLAHSARTTVEFLARETPEFIPSELWVQNSLDFNLVDYSVWGILQERVYHTCCRSGRNETTFANWMGLDGPLDHSGSNTPVASPSQSMSLCRWRTLQTLLLTGIYWQFKNLQIRLNFMF